jgi:SAM-dependent methyltransferase
MLSRAGLNVDAFDYRPGLEPAVVPLERYPHVSVSLSPDPRLLPFDDAAFDAVLSCGVLEHVEDPDASLEEIRRVLTPGGTFYVYKLPNRTSYLEAIARRSGMYYHGAYEDDRVYTRVSATQLLARHGFEVVEARRMNMLPLTLTGNLATRLARPIWAASRALSAVPGVNLLATNVELVARVSPRSSSPPPPTSSAARDGEHGQRTTQPSSA